MFWILMNERTQASKKANTTFFAIEQHHESQKITITTEILKIIELNTDSGKWAVSVPLNIQIVNASKIKVGRISTATPRFDNNCFFLLNRLSFVSLFICFVIVSIGEWCFNGYIVKFVELLELKSTMQPGLEILIDFAN